MLRPLHAYFLVSRHRTHHKSIGTLPFDPGSSDSDDMAYVASLQLPVIAHQTAQTLLAEKARRQTSPLSTPCQSARLDTVVADGLVTVPDRTDPVSGSAEGGT
ncbi:hypothetical protein AA0535_1282 [Asaia krungthepensis NRIC 0535]|uniref:Uncharacterized protein n=1 Tax=Asaia krungthepensis NRIC 0535 TaxID=1307925 RepID=A0ABQ0Q1W5_9PROT|nr:hypothetical protein AA0535_1282 [Asaia krungthepensis NRIC 0535]